MNDRPEKLQQVQELTCKLLDHELSADESRQLESLLFGDPEACELYLNLTTLDAHLSRELTGQAPPVVDVPAGELSSDRPKPARKAKPSGRRSPVWRIGRFAAAATVLLAVGAGVLALRSPAVQPVVACATLMEATSVEWAAVGPVRHVGDRIEPSTLNVTKGTLVVKFDGGAVATLTGPAELQIENRKTAELRHGTVLIRAEHDTGGFTLRTSASDYVDLGTEFGVLINDDASSEVHVFEGVVIARPRGNDLVVPVLRNEAGRVEPERGDLVAIEANPSKFPGITTMTLASLNALANHTNNAANAATTVTPTPVVISPSGPGVTAYPPLPANARIVFLGDRATDGETHLLLLSQTMSRIYSPLDQPKLFNVGVSVPLNFSPADIDRYVSPLKPTHAVLEYGPEMAAGPRHLTAAQFETELRLLLTRLTADAIEPILATGFRLGEHQSPCQKLLNDYNEVIRNIAREKGYRLADVDNHFHSLDPCKLSLVAPSGAIPTFGGYQQVASVLLSAMGHPGQRVDATLRLSLLPGAVTQWKYRIKTKDDSLNDAREAKLNPDSSWSELVLPQPDDKFLARMADSTHSATYRDRERGVATGLCRSHDQTVEAVGYVESCEARSAYLNVGACVRNVWLNDKKVYANPTRWIGWHPGKERVKVDLVMGTNKIVVESGGSLFVSVTDEVDWPVQ